MVYNSKVKIPYGMLICLCASSLLAQVRPSWQNAATQGSAVALPSEDAFIDDNPAANEQPLRANGELGVAGIGSKQMVPFLLAALPVSQESMVGLGWMEPKPGALDQHLLELTGTSHILSGTWIGMRGTVQKTPTKTNMEMGLGGYHRISSFWRLGWNVENLTKSLDSSACGQCAQRHFDVGATWFYDSDERFGIYADLARNNLQLSDYKQVQPSAGLRAQFGPNRNVQLILGVQASSLDSNKSVSASGGVAFQQYFFNNLVSIRYALSGLGIIGNHSEDLTHQISFGFVWDAFADHIDPKPFVRATVATLSMTGEDHLPRDLDFLLRVEENSGKLADWSLVVYSVRKDLSPTQLVRRFQGTGMPPSGIHWFGDDVAGNPCPVGLYAYRLIARDAAGNEGWTEWQHLEIR